MNLFKDSFFKCRTLFSNRAGPNGPASMTAMKDLVALREDTELYNAVSKMLKQFNKIDLDNVFNEKSYSKAKHSKIVGLSDKAGKTRIVAIADY